MADQQTILLEKNYRLLFGKTFAALIHHFGPRYTSEIEDAVQNSFLKLMKSWGTKKTPYDLENWLFVSAKNDLLNQIKRIAIFDEISEQLKEVPKEPCFSDPRLEAILQIMYVPILNTQQQTIYILKNIFGLSVGEISEATLLGEEAIYKSNQRTRAQLKKVFQHNTPRQPKADSNVLQAIEEMLYAVFNLGYDSFDAKQQTTINNDLCLEALAMAKHVMKAYQRTETRHLISLFCFHLARLNAKVVEAKLIPFLEQDRSKWNQELIQLGYHYLIKPEQLNQFYIEALIISKYMNTTSYSAMHWQEIAALYQILYTLHPSPIVQLNLCYALHQGQKNAEALKVLQQAATKLPDDHTYLKLVKAALLGSTAPQKSKQLFEGILLNMKQAIRKDFLMMKSQTQVD